MHKDRVSSENRGGAARTRVTPGRSRQHTFAVCVSNQDYPASLELRKLYRVLDDRFACQHDLIRVIDESGDDYLYPTSYFVAVDLPKSVRRRLQQIA
jgi:hypothetical protein